MEKPRLDVTPELFLVDDRDGALLYAPLKGVLARIPAGLAEEIRACRPGDPLSTLGPRAVAVLNGLGLLGSEPPHPVSDSGPPTGTFKPVGVIFLVTSACNLRCTYCYADAGDRITEPFDRTMGRDAVRLVVDNAARDGGTAYLSFHGGGEPTLDFSFITEMVRFARDYAVVSSAGRPVPVNTSLVTNGMLPRERADWIAENLDSVQVSLDGPTDIHDLQRPTRRAKGSHARVEEVVHQFEAANLELMIKATISRAAVHRMDEIAEYLCATFSLPRFHLGPVLGAGRGRSETFGQPGVAEFLDGFRRARDVARRYGRTVVVSGAQTTFPKIRRAFCGLTDPNFALAADGSISACYEVIYPEDPRAPRFHYGRYDRVSREFVVDEEKISEIRGRDVTRIPRCQDCFAKWHCAGDCQARWYDSLDGTEERGVDVRCEIARELVRESLLDALTRR